jgi:hypothetical protein
LLFAQSDPRREQANAATQQKPEPTLQQRTPGYGAGWRKLESCTPRWSEWLGRDFSMSGRSRNALDLRAGDEQLHRLAALIADLEVTFKDYSIGLVD